MSDFGWFKFHRKFLYDDVWLKEPFTKGQAWIDMVGLSNHKDGFIELRGLTIAVKRGKLGYSELSLSIRWKWSRNKVRRFLKELKTEQQIEQQIYLNTSIITILNYDYYQGNDTTDETTERQQKDTNKNNKNEKKEYTSDFLAFFYAYPKKEAKRDAFKAWVQMNSSRPELAALLKEIDRQKGTEKWKEAAGRYIPLPATWLRGERWEDTIDNKPSDPIEAFEKRQKL